MNVNKFLKHQKTILYGNLIVGLGLLITGILMKLNKITIFNNDFLFTRLSTLTFAFAGLALYRIIKTTKKPQSMHKTIINEYDERLIAIRNEAEAKTTNVLRIGLYIAYLVTDSKFDVLFLSFIIFSFILTGLFESMIMSKESNS